MGHISIHGADLESERRYQSLWSQNRRNPSRPVAGLWHILVQQRPQRETNTSIFPPCSIPFLLPSPLLCMSLRPTVCLPCPLSFAVTCEQTQHGSLVYSQMERGLIVSCYVWSCWFAGPFKIVRRSEYKSKEFWLQLGSHTQCFKDRTAIVIITTLALSEHKQSYRNFQTRIQFAHYGIVLFRCVHSLKTTGSNDCETLWLEDSVCIQAFYFSRNRRWWLIVLGLDVM